MKMGILQTVVNAFSGAATDVAALGSVGMNSNLEAPLQEAVPALIKSIGDSFEVDVYIHTHDTGPHSFIGFDLFFPIGVVSPKMLNGSPEHANGDVYQGLESDMIASLSQAAGVQCIAVSKVLKSQQTAVESQGLVITLKFSVIGQGSGFCEIKNRKIGRIVDGIDKKYQTTNDPLAVTIQQPAPEPTEPVYLFYIEVR
jgi:hypothetical protein